MDVLFNPSTTETFGNVTLEAMACGVPVVAARATGSSCLVADGGYGRLVPPDDIAAFADALAAYIEDPQLRAAHGRAGEERSRAYTWDTINRGHLPAPYRSAPVPCISVARPPGSFAAHNTTAQRRE